MQNIGQTTNVDKTAGEAIAFQYACQFLRAGRIRATRDTNKKVIAGFTDVATINRARRSDAVQLRIELRKCCAYRHNFAGATWSARTRDNSAQSRYYSCIFNEGRIRKCVVWFATNESNAAAFQGRAINRM